MIREAGRIPVQRDTFYTQAADVRRPMIRLGRVDYINTFPLAWSLARHLGDGLAEEVVGRPDRAERAAARR